MLRPETILCDFCPARAVRSVTTGRRESRRFACREHIALARSESCRVDMGKPPVHPVDNAAWVRVVDIDELERILRSRRDRAGI